jgi:heterodisulfide reductase subunit A-like polyferredoxin
MTGVLVDRGLLTKLVPVECHPDPQPKLARAFSKAEQFLLTGVSQKLLQDFKKSVSLHSDTQEVPQEFAERKTVVVIGAGICGLSVCHELSAASDTFRVILIDKKDYFEFTPMIVRQLSAYGFMRCCCCPVHCVVFL